MPEIVGTLKPPRLASAPSTPALGQLYFDTTSGTLRTWNGTAWAPLGLPADIVVAAATRILANKLLVGDAQPAFRIMGDGTIEWGPGGGTAPNLSLSRYGSSALAFLAGLAVRHDWGIWTEGSTPAASAAFAHYAPGSDAQPRVQIAGDGTLKWGPGGATVPDTNLYRAGASILRTDDTFYSAEEVVARLSSIYQISIGYVAGYAGISFSNAGDLNLYRIAAATLHTDGDFQAISDITARRYAAAQTIIGARGPSGESGIAFGSAVDIVLYRAAADVLKLDDAFWIGAGFPIILNNGGAGVDGVQVELAYLGSSRQYRHHIDTIHDGGIAANNMLDFYIWTPVDAAGTLGTKRVLRLRGDGALVFADGTVQTTAGGGGGVDYENDWSAATAYIPGDVVRYGGQHWIAVNPGTNQVPGAAADAGFGTAFPTTPVDGMEFTLVDSLTAPTYAWRFRYVASITDAYKWVFVGGSPMHAEASASQSTTSTSFVDLTGGPSLVLPRTGIYEVEFGDSQQTSQDGTSVISSVAATGLSPSDQLAIYTASAPPVNGARRFITAAAISGTLKMQYRVTAQTGTYFNRWLSARPVRVS